MRCTIVVMSCVPIAGCCRTLLWANELRSVAIYILGGNVLVCYTFLQMVESERALR